MARSRRLSKEDYFEALLAEYKKADKDAGVNLIHLFHSEEVVRLCAAWPNAGFELNFYKATDGPCECWDDLWEAHLMTWWEVGGIRKLADASGIPSDEILKPFLVCRQNMLIFPDGTVSQWVTGYLTGIVRTKLGIAGVQGADE